MSLGEALQALYPFQQGFPSHSTKLNLTMLVCPAGLFGKVPTCGSELPEKMTCLQISLQAFSCQKMKRMCFHLPSIFISNTTNLSGNFIVPMLQSAPQTGDGQGKD